MRFFQIVFWRKNDPDVKREHDVIINEFDPCPRYDDYVSSLRGRRDVSDERVTAEVNNLWAFSDLQAAVLVLNGAKTGALSNVIDFTTPEGRKRMHASPF